MQIGIGLPNTIPGAQVSTILEWARKADDGPFSSLGTLDRLVFPNYEGMMTLAAAASITRRIRLMTTVLIAPLRNPGVLAKQAATLDALSGGRLTLGLGIGGREDDFIAADINIHERGRRFSRQLDFMRHAWAGEAPLAGVAPMGPKPARAGGPEVLIGGYSAKAVQRAAQWDGFIAGGTTPENAAQLYAVVQQAWQEAGRQGKPRFVCAAYCALGPDAAERGGGYLRTYYAFLGANAEQIASHMPSTPDAVKQTIQRFQAIGADELILWPCIADLDQVDRLAEVVS